MLICTPFYIEDLVNRDSRQHFGNMTADKGNAEQIRRSLVAGALISAIPSGPRDPLQHGRPQREVMVGGSTDVRRQFPRLSALRFSRICVPLQTDNTMMLPGELCAGQDRCQCQPSAEEQPAPSLGR